MTESHALDFVFEFADGTPAGGFDYVLVKPDGKREPGKLPSGGTIHRDNVAPGAYTVLLKEVEDVSWDVGKTIPGEEVNIVARVSGFADGASVKVRIFRAYQESDDKVLDTLSGSVQGDKVTVAYKFDDSPKERAAWQGEVELVAEVSLEGGAHWAKTLSPLAITMCSIDRAAWLNRNLEDGDDAELIVDTSGYEDGTKVKAELYWSDAEGDDEKLADLDPVPLAAGSASFKLGCKLDDTAERFASGTIGASGELYAIVSMDHDAKRTRRTPRLIVHGGAP